MKRYKYLFCDFDGTLVDTLSGKTFPEGIWDMKVKFDVLDKIKDFVDGAKICNFFQFVVKY